MKKFFLTQTLFDNRDKVFLEYDEQKAVLGKEAYERLLELHSLTEMFEYLIYVLRLEISLPPKEAARSFYEVELPSGLKFKPTFYASQQYPFWQLKIRENKDNGNIIFYGEE